MRSIKVPRALQERLQEEARWTDDPKGSQSVVLESPLRRGRLLTFAAACFLPWNKRRQPSRASQGAEG
jgi:hypothetical protein